MTIRKRSIAVQLLAIAGVVFLAAMSGAEPAWAQSPVPNAYFLDWAPGNHSATTNGLQVEGLGGINCSYSQSSVEAAAVYDLNTLRHATIVEISPQSGCGTISQYETLISNINAYVVAHAPNHYVQLFGGFIMDEEPGFGFSYSQLVTLNEHVSSVVTSTSGSDWWYANQGNCSGCWTQSQYNTLTYYSGHYNGTPAPQVYNNFMRDQANNSGFNYQMVNCWSGAPYPYNQGCTVGLYPHTNGSYAAQSVNGSPYNYRFGTSNAFLWENKFQAQ